MSPGCTKFSSGLFPQLFDKRRWFFSLLYSFLVQLYCSTEIPEKIKMLVPVIADFLPIVA